MNSIVQYCNNYLNTNIVYTMDECHNYYGVNLQEHDHHGLCFIFQALYITILVNILLKKRTNYKK